MFSRRFPYWLTFTFRVSCWIGQLSLPAFPKCIAWWCWWWMLGYHVDLPAVAKCFACWCWWWLLGHHVNLCLHTLLRHITVCGRSPFDSLLSALHVSVCLSLATLFRYGVPVNFSDRVLSPGGLVNYLRWFLRSVARWIPQRLIVYPVFRQCGHVRLPKQCVFVWHNYVQQLVFG